MGNIVFDPNVTWRVNQSEMEMCCYETLKLEMYRRGDAKEPLMRDGDTIKCSTCNSETICDNSLRDGQLRWRWNDKE